MVQNTKCDDIHLIFAYKHLTADCSNKLAQFRFCYLLVLFVAEGNFTSRGITINVVDKQIDFFN
jgi:hypothetical protein